MFSLVGYVSAFVESVVCDMHPLYIATAVLEHASPSPPARRCFGAGIQIVLPEARTLLATFDSELIMESLSMHSWVCRTGSGSIKRVTRPTVSWVRPQMRNGAVRTTVLGMVARPLLTTTRAGTEMNLSFATVRSLGNELNNAR